MTERTQRVTTFLNEQEYTMLGKQCAKANLNQSAYLRSLIVSGKPAGPQPGYTELLQHIADLDGAVFSLAEAAKANPELQGEDMERLLFLMDSVWNKVKGSL